MEPFLQKLIKLVDQVNENVGKLTAWLTCLLVLLVCYDVTVRYIFNNTQTWIMELEWHLFAMIFLLGSGYALKHNRHVRVDLFYAKYATRDKAQTNFIGTLVFLIPWCIIIIIYATQFAYASYLDQEGSPNPGGLPARYLIKSTIVIGIGLLLFQAIGELAKSILLLQSDDDT